jgi:UDP-N-acetylmuramoyl-tripeptide--D-alanyl-D-alanine ligase
MGMNHANELNALSRMVRPHIALITTIAPVHIGNFRDIQEVAAAKAEIFEGMDADGHVVLNADNEFTEFLTTRAKAHGLTHIHTFGKSGNDAQVKNFTLHENHSDVNAVILNKNISFTLSVAGEHWVMNSLGVLLAASLAGADMEKAAATLGHLTPANGRGITKDIQLGTGHFTLIDESYNASPVAVEMAIKVLARKNGRKLLVLGDMRELGNHAREAHLGLKQPILSAGIAKVFCCGELMKHLYDSLPAELQGGYAFTSSDLAPLVRTQIQAGDVITIKGSHSMMMEKVVTALELLDFLRNPLGCHAGEGRHPR